VRDLTINVNSNGTGIDVDHQLNYSVIEVHINSITGAGNGVVGLDLKESDGTGRIGIRNTIHVTTGIVNQLPDTIVDLPTGWSTTPKNTTSDVIINGRQYYPPTDEF
jgi:hypothetical protein